MRKYILNLKVVVLICFMSLFNTQLLWAACDAPSATSATNVTSSSATLNWSSVVEAVEFRLRYRTVNPSVGDWVYEENISGNSISVSGLDGNTKYQFQVLSECASENSSFSSSRFFTTLIPYVCQDPTSFSVSNATSSSVEFSWDTIATEGIEYSVRYRSINPVLSNWSRDNDISNVSHILSGLDASTRYQAQIAMECALDNSSNSGYGSSVFFDTENDFVCSTPTNFTLTAITSTSLSYSWSPVVGSGAEYGLRYRTVNPVGDWVFVNDLTNTNIEITGLEVETRYQVQVFTECSANNSSTSGLTTLFSTTDISYECTTPSPFFLTSTGDDNSTFGWSEVNGTGAEYVIRYRTITPSVEAYQFLNDVSGSSETLTGLTPGARYQVAIATECSSDNSSRSGYSSSEFYYTNPNYDCEPPTNISSSGITTDEITFNWDQEADAEYTLRYRSDQVVDWTEIEDVDSDNITLTGLESGILYLFEIRTECSLDNVVKSNFSETDSAITVYDVDCDSHLPLSYSVDSTSFSVFKSSWTDSNPFGVYELGYRRIDQEFQFLTGITGSEAIVEGLDAGSMYYTYLRLDCSNEYVESFSSWSDSILFSTSDCGEPTSFSTMNEMDNSATVSWNTVANVDGYSIWYAPKSATSVQFAFTATESIDLTGLDAGTLYRFEVRSVCDSTNGALSPFSTSPRGNRNDFNTTGTPTCDPPSNFIIDSFGDDFVNLTWDTEPNVAYIVSSRVISDPIWTNTSAQTNGAHTYSGLGSGSTYRFRVLAGCNNGASSSEWTDFLEVTTTGAISCDVPTNLTVSSITSSSADLMWDDVATANSYSIRHRKTSESDWTYSSSATANFTLTGLDSDVRYQVQVSSLCSGTVASSGSSQSEFFDTESVIRNGESFENSSISFYPNPSEGLLYLNSKEDNLVDISVFTLQGQNVGEFLSINTSEPLNVSYLKKGTYLFVVNEKNEENQQQYIITKK